MTIKTIYSSILVLCLLSCSVETYHGTYEKGDLTSYFKQPLRFYNNDTKLQYCVLNDSSNIYLLIKATEQLPQYKIMQTGIKVSIDTNGKYKSGASIIYPIPQKQNRLSSFLYTNDWETFMSRFQYENIYMKIDGFTSINETEILNKNNYGLNVTMSWDSVGVLYYKASIPFTLLRKNNSTDSTALYGIKVVLGDIPSTTKAEENNNTETGFNMYQQKMNMRSNQTARMQTMQTMTESQSYLSNIKTLKFVYKPTFR